MLSQLARVPPIIVTAVLIGLFASSTVALTNAVPVWIAALATLSPNIFVAAWAWGLREVSSRRPPYAHYLVTMVLLVLLAVFLFKTDLGLNSRIAVILLQAFILVVFLLWYVFVLWSGAEHLVLLEENSPQWHVVAGTFVLMFFLPIGIWLLHKRLERVTERVTE